MKIEPECFACILRRILSTAGRITDDRWLHHKLLAEAMQELAEVERDLTPAEVMLGVEALISKTLGSTDPYQKERAEWFEKLEGVDARIESRVKASSNPLETALLVAARANVFDDECLSGREIRDELNRTGVRSDDAEPADEKFAVNDVDLFLRDLKTAERLLFLHDSGPELPFDRVLLKNLAQAQPELEITCVVRARPILLDATQDDFEHFDLAGVAGVTGCVDPGIPALGIPLNECSREFRELVDASDVIVGKGQAHFETLEGLEKAVYFLMRVKCPVMAKNQGLSVGELAFFKP